MKTGARKSLEREKQHRGRRRPNKGTSGNMIWRRTRRTSGNYRNQIRTTHRNVAQAKIGSHRSSEAKRKTQQHRQIAKTILPLKFKHNSHIIMKFTVLPPSF
jgi:hypothetical protein